MNTRADLAAVVVVYAASISFRALGFVDVADPPADPLDAHPLSARSAADAGRAT